MTPQPVIRVEGLVKRFGEITALKGIDFSVAPGSVLGLLGRGGAGKSTLVRVLTAELEPDAGRITVAGFDLAGERDMALSKLGYVGRCAQHGLRTGYGFLLDAGRVARLPSQVAQRRATALMERLDLTPLADRLIWTWDDDLKLRRLDLAAALIVDPVALVLDEPVTGLAPADRLAVWELLGEQVACGAALLLTTRDMDEAGAIADQLLVLDRGTAIAEGRPGRLTLKTGGTRLEATVRDCADLPRTTAALAGIGDGEPDVTGRRVSAPVTRGESALVEAAWKLGRADIPLDDLRLLSPSLADTFRPLRRP